MNDGDLDVIQRFATNEKRVEEIYLELADSIKFLTDKSVEAILNSNKRIEALEVENKILHEAFAILNEYMILEVTRINQKNEDLEEAIKLLSRVMKIEITQFKSSINTIHDLVKKINITLLQDGSFQFTDDIIKDH